MMYRKSPRPMNDTERAKIEAWINFERPEKPSGLWRRLWARASGETDFRNRLHEARQRNTSKNREILTDGHVIVHSLQPCAAVELRRREPGRLRRAPDRPTRRGPQVGNEHAGAASRTAASRSPQRTTHRTAGIRHPRPIAKHQWCRTRRKSLCDAGSLDGSWEIRRDR